MSYKKTILYYIGLKFSLVALCCGVMIIHKKLVAFWYSPLNSVEATQEQIKTTDNIAIDEYNSSGMTALMIVASEGNKAMVEMLLNNGAHVNARAQKDPLLPDTEGATPLYLAVLNGNSDVVGLLLENGADPKAATVQGATPLHALSSIANPDIQKIIFEMLMQRGADLNAQNVDGSTALYWLVEQNNIDLVAKALAEHRAAIDLSLKNKDGYTLLELARSLAKESIATMLEQAQ